jgi:hypothetical protein
MTHAPPQGALGHHHFLGFVAAAEVRESTDEVRESIDEVRESKDEVRETEDEVQYSKYMSMSPAWEYGTGSTEANRHRHTHGPMEARTAHEHIQARASPPRGYNKDRMKCDLVKMECGEVRINRAVSCGITHLAEGSEEFIK